MLTDDEIVNRVEYHPPSKEGAVRHKMLSEAAGEFMAKVDEIVPDGREKSVAMTHIETAKMWASAGVARNPETV